MQQSLLIGAFVLITAFQYVNYSAAKLAPKHSSKSSEMLSNNLPSYANANNNFDNDLSAHPHIVAETAAEAELEQEEVYSRAHHALDDAILNTNTVEHDTVLQQHTQSKSNSNSNNKHPKTHTNNTKINLTKPKTHSQSVMKQKASGNSNKFVSSTTDQHLRGHVKAHSMLQQQRRTNATNESDKAVIKAIGNRTNIKQTTTTATTTGRHAAGDGRGDTAPVTTQTKIYRPSGFVNPFGQLVAFFGSDQLHLQDYNFLFNAERHTVFQLHTSIPAMKSGTNAAVAAAASGRVLNVVSDSIGAVLGVSAPVGVGAVNAAMGGIRVEEIQLYNAASLRQSRFNPFNPTRILIHGWFGGSHAGIYQTLVPEYLKLGAGNYNVITVDWGRGAIADYITASYRVKPVGKVVAKFIDFLQREAGVRFEDLHVVGFSMGAHIAGIAGKFVQTGRLPIIYALDPALPFFRYENIDERVAITDADYVEVIHTSVGSYGFDRPLGHVDYYVNWGSAQPGCFFNECSHFRAFQIFAESLHDKEAFRAQGCDVNFWQDLIKHRRCVMGTGRELALGGDPANVTALRGRGGVYYFATNASPPFSKGAT